MRGIAGSAAMAVCLALSASALAQDDGAAIYKSKCEHCHGAHGMSHTLAGKMTGAVQFSNPEVVSMPDADLVMVVKNGKKKMPAFGKKLSDNQISAVIAYVHTLQHPAAGN